MMVNYFSFEDVMKELQVDEEELKRMVSEGEIRAFRSESKMKFKKEDIEALKKGRGPEPTVILPSTPTPPPKGAQAVDETILDLDIDQEPDKKKIQETPTQRIAHPAKQAKPSEEETLIDAEELSVEKEEEKAPEKGPDETFLEEEGAITTDTEPLKLADETETEVTREISEEVVEEEIEAPALAPRFKRPKRLRKMPPVVEEAIEKRRPSIIWTALMFIVLAATLFFVVITYEGLRTASEKVYQPSSVTSGLARWVLEKYWADQSYVEKFIKSKYPKDKDGNTVTPPFGLNYDIDYSKPTFDKPITVKSTREELPK